ncbi:MAG: S1 RNA-binding domain-containing protein [Anaerolineae bacterium]|nr:S1 RNA-binding domain-containing protein [Thermoflexus sp.]MDW8065382.1 S1 RNA-binding domain-containing protein [Anaerolineae bacterium]
METSPVVLEQQEETRSSIKIPLRSLRPKMQIEGVVLTVTPAGAFVDISSEIPGFLHISQFSPQPVPRGSDILKPGDRVTVWVKQVNRKKNLLSLTMIRPATYGWGQLKPGREFVGRITRLEPGGIYVDIDAPVEGFVPASQIRKEGRVDPTSLFQVGEEVKVWVVSVSRRERRLRLTMIPPPSIKWEELKIGEITRGKITRVEKFGAFVDIGAERDALIHVSEFGVRNLKDPSEVLREGEEIEARIILVDPEKKQIRLSLRGLLHVREVKPELPSQQTVRSRSTIHEVEPEEEELTAMAYALKRALQEAQARGRPISTLESLSTN